MEAGKIKEVEDILRRFHLGACYNFEEMAVQIHAVYQDDAARRQLRRRFRHRAKNHRGKLRRPMQAM